MRAAVDDEVGQDDPFTCAACSGSKGCHLVHTDGVLKLFCLSKQGTKRLNDESWYTGQSALFTPAMQRDAALQAIKDQQVRRAVRNTLVSRFLSVGLFRYVQIFVAFLYGRPSLCPASRW